MARQGGAGRGQARQGKARVVSNRSSERTSVRKPWEAIVKSIWTSKTFYFNLLALVVAIAAAFGYSGELPAGWAVYVPSIIAVINVILRLLVKQPIGGPVARAMRGE